jgi:hypothetical protein
MIRLPRENARALLVLREDGSSSVAFVLTESGLKAHCLGNKPESSFKTAVRDFRVCTETEQMPSTCHCSLTDH